MKNNCRGCRKRSMDKEKRFQSIIKKPRKILLKNWQSPGDVLIMTSAVRDLKLSHPEIEIGIHTSCKEIWENNPYITELNEKDEDVEVIRMEYPLIHNSNEGQYHFIHGFRKFLEDKLNIRIKATKFKGDIHISEEEKSWISQIEEMGITDTFWIIVNGGKMDFSAKWPNPLYMQEVVDHFEGKITFVQCGEEHHHHPKLNNVIDLIGKTNLRQFIRLIYHSVGVLCPVTFAMHAAVAIESKHGLLNRPCVVLAGGREPPVWETYSHHQYLHRMLPCSDRGGCWKSRANKIGDGDSKDLDDKLCIYPEEIDYEYKNGENLNIARCINLIKSQDIIRAIETYYEGGILKYH